MVSPLTMFMRFSFPYQLQLISPRLFETSENGKENQEDWSCREYGTRQCPRGGGGGGYTLGIFGWGCAAGTLEPLVYTTASSAEFCYPIITLHR